MKKFAAIVWLLILTVSASAASHGSPYANTGSPLGTNLFNLGMQGFTPELPLLNVMKYAYFWTTQNNSGSPTHEENLLQVDSNGYVESLTQTNVGGAFPGGTTRVQVSFLNSLPTFNGGTPYPGGNDSWVLLYDGAGTVTLTGDATLDAGTSCASLGITTGGSTCQVYNVTPSAGMTVTISAVTGGNWINNIRIVQVRYANLLTSGEMFDPNFISMVKPYRQIRFVDWNETDYTTRFYPQLVDWSQRTTPTYCCWAGQNNSLNAGNNIGGAPIELDVALCNEIHADCWIDMPCLANDTYISNAATLIHGLLKSDLKILSDIGNEIFTHYCDTVFSGYVASSFTGAISGTPPNLTLTVSAVATPHLTASSTAIAVGDIITGTGVSAVTYVKPFGTNGTTGVGGTGTYAIDCENNPGCTQSVSSETMAGSNGYNAHQPAYFPTGDANNPYDYYVLRATHTADVFMSAWGSNNGNVIPIMLGQAAAFGAFGQNRTNMSMLGTHDGGSASYWAGEASSHFKVLSVAPYWGPGQLIPAYVTGLPGGGLDQLFQETLIGGLIPTALDKGNCGNGAGTLCGGPLHYTYTSGNSYSCPPANGSAIGFNSTSNGSSGDTIAVDGCATQYPIQDNTGAALTVCNGCFYTGFFTTSTAGGPATPAWRMLPNGFCNTTSTNAGSFCTAKGFLDGAALVIAEDFIDAQAFTGVDGLPLRLYGYESGQGLTGGSASSEVNQMFLNAQSDPRMANVYSTYYADIFAQGVIAVNHYNDVSTWSTSGTWGLLQGTQQVIQGLTDPKQQGLLDYIRRNPCTWVGCYQ